MSREPLIIAGVTIKPGEKVTTVIPVARLYTNTEMGMPVHVIHGRRKGPRLFVCGAIHGDEIIGTEIIRRLVKMKKILGLKGTLIGVPVVNVYGFLNQSRYSPDRRDLNRFFPGSEKGSLTSQLADIFIEEIVNGSAYGIDLHAGSNHRSNLPQIRADLDNEETKRLSIAFGAPLVLHKKIIKGSLRNAVADKGIPLLLYEAGEALRLDEISIQSGVRGVLSVMEAVGMLKPKPSRKSKIEPLIADTTTWVRALGSGMLQMSVPLGKKVEKGEVLGEIADPFGTHVEKICSPVDGMVIGRLNLPLVHQGDAVIHIALIDKPTMIDPVIAEYNEELRKIQQ